MHYWADLQLVDGFGCYGNTHTKCEMSARTLVYSLYRHMLVVCMTASLPTRSPCWIPRDVALALLLGDRGAAAARAAAGVCCLYRPVTRLLLACELVTYLAKSSRTIWANAVARPAGRPNEIIIGAHSSVSDIHVRYTAGVLSV